MAGEPVSIGNETQLRNWLNGKPKEFAQVIAMRAALRILPVAGRSVELPDDQLEQFQKLRLMLTTFRALFISWAARVYPITNFDADASAAALAFSTVVSASRRTIFLHCTL